jgi:Fungal protein kinase
VYHCYNGVQRPRQSQIDYTDTSIAVFDEYKHIGEGPFQIETKQFRRGGGKKIPGSSSIAEHGVIPSSSNHSQENNANESFVPPLAPRKSLPPEIQLLSYFCEVMSAARYRDWTSGAIISGLDFSLVTCDREGAIMSAPTSLGTEEGATIFSKWVLAIGSGTLIQSGFANIFGEIARQLDGLDFSIPDHAKRTSRSPIRLKFGKQQYGAFGRGTTVYRVDVTIGDESIQGVCKISWPAASRDSEYDLIQQARVVDPDHLPEVVCSWDIKESNLPSRMLRQDCPETAVEHEPRVLRIVVSPFYGPVHELRGDDFLAAFWDAMLCTSYLIYGR